MSVLSRHRTSAPTQREMPMPKQRSAPASETGPGQTALRPSAPLAPPTPTRDRRRVTLIAGGGLVAALAIGTGAYLVLEDDGGSAKVIAPVVNVPDFADLARDRAMAARGPQAYDATEAKRDAALARRAQNLPAAAIAGSATSAASDADRITEAQRDAALARRARNFTAE